MKAEVRQALMERLLAMGDDEMILSHRNSEWCGHAPILEEDIAFANIALDEMGHAIAWYRLLSDLAGEDRETHPDRLVFFREPTEYRNVQFVELPKGDWAFTILRQFLFDQAEAVQLEGLVTSTYSPLADAAAKVQQEERYHLRHTSAWLRRLGLGTEESRRRMQSALARQWPYALRMFDWPEAHSPLVEEGIVPPPDRVRGDWLARVTASLEDASLAAPDEITRTVGARGEHSEHLRDLLTDMQSMARAHPGVDW